MSDRCWLATTLRLDDPCLFRADGKPDPAHIAFAKNWLTKAPTGPHLSVQQAHDPRIIRPACRKHHQSLDAGSLTLPRQHLPDSVFEYAEEFGLLGKLDRDFPREEER